MTQKFITNTESEYPGRITRHYYRSSPQAWIMMTDKAVLLQQYHWGVPEAAKRESVTDLDGCSHYFPVVEFRRDSEAYRTLEDHLKNFSEKLCSCAIGASKERVSASS